jgi:hypothetical protein
VGSTDVGSQSGRGERICEDLYVTGTGFKNYLTLMMMIIIIITLTKMIMVIMMTMMTIHLFLAADNDMSISELHMENKWNHLKKLFQSTHKLVKA